MAAYPQDEQLPHWLNLSACMAWCAIGAISLPALEQFSSILTRAGARVDLPGARANEGSRHWSGLAHRAVNKGGSAWHPSATMPGIETNSYKTTSRCNLSGQARLAQARRSLINCLQPGGSARSSFFQRWNWELTCRYLRRAELTAMEGQLPLRLRAASLTASMTWG